MLYDYNRTLPCHQQSERQHMHASQKPQRQGLLQQTTHSTSQSALTQALQV